MDKRVILAAENEEKLNKLIDGKIKEGYLLSGGMHMNEQNQLTQILTLAHNIDDEFTFSGAVRLIFLVMIGASVMILMF